MGCFKDDVYHEHDIEQLKRDGEAAHARMDRALTAFTPCSEAEHRTALAETIQRTPGSSRDFATLDNIATRLRQTRAAWETIDDSDSMAACAAVDMLDEIVKLVTRTGRDCEKV